MKTKQCRVTGKSFVITAKEDQIRKASSPVVGGKLYEIPEADLHPDVFHQWHYAWRNERTLYKGICVRTGKPILTNINPEQGYTVMNFKDRRGDVWEPMEYGRDVDFSVSFTKQFGEMFRDMPQLSLTLSDHMENCDYCNYGYYAKSCYMATTAVWSENCYYSYLPFKCTYDVDGYANSMCEKTYECVFSQGCFESTNCYYTTDTKFSHYMLDCENCEYCFGCVNLINAKYCIFNKQYSKEEYEQAVNQLLSQYSRKDIYERFQQFSLQYPKRATRGKSNESSVGDLLYETSGLSRCFDIRDCADSVECWTSGVQSSDLARCTMVGIGKRYYGSTGTATSDKCGFDYYGTNNSSIYYSMFCRNCEHCFGCVRLLHKKYCIFNKQYTKEEYEQLLPQLIAHMEKTGEYGLPISPSIAPFPYNDTLAHEWFPETKESTEEMGWLWIDPLQQSSQHVVGDDIVTCEVTERQFKLIQQEKEFYINLNLPLPTKHHLQRHLERFDEWVLPRDLFERTCAKTGEIIMAPYAPERKEIVWSNEAWDQEYRG